MSCNRWTRGVVSISPGDEPELQVVGLGVAEIGIPRCRSLGKRSISYSYSALAVLVLDHRFSSTSTSTSTSTIKIKIKIKSTIERRTAHHQKALVEL